MERGASGRGDYLKFLQGVRGNCKEKQVNGEVI